MRSPAPPLRARRVRNPGAARGCEGAREAAAKAPALSAARGVKDGDSSPAEPPHPQKSRSEQLQLRWVGDGQAARALGAAGGSAAAAALCAFSGRSAWVHEMGRADAAAGAEILPGNPKETPRQPAQGVG